MDDLEKALTEKSQCQLLKEEIIRLEKELGINQLPTKEEYSQERFLWEKLLIWLGIKNEADITIERRHRYEIIKLTRDEELIFTNTGYGISVRRMDEEDAAIIYQHKIKKLQQLKAKRGIA